MTVRTRFAPSPTGFMHIGNLRTCLYAYYYAKQNNGKFILRIEDTDRERYVDGAVELIYKTLKMAGIEHDEGPDIGGDYGSYVQSERMASGIYLEYAKKLVDLGGAYYCFCTPEETENMVVGGIKRYNKKCLSLTRSEVEERLARGESYVIRQNVPSEGVSEYVDMVFGKIAVPNADIEDGILIKSDGMPTYNFANVIDDHLMAISHVIRGMEYLSSTPKYNLMYDAFGWERPQYMHLPPIMRDAQHKLSKRYGDANFEDFINKGFMVEAIVNYISLLGWAPQGTQEKLNIKELIEQFDVSGVSHSGSIFDEAKMRWLNGEYIKELTPEEFAEHAKPFFDSSEIADKLDYVKLSELLIPRIEIFSEIPEKVNPLAHFDDYDLGLYENKKNKITKEIALNALKDIESAFCNLDEWSETSMQLALAEIIEKGGYKKAQVYLSLRVALTGAPMSPGGGTEMALLFGKEESMRRIAYGIARLSA